MTSIEKAKVIVSGVKYLSEADATALVAACLEEARLLGAKQEAEEHLQSMRERQERWHELRAPVLQAAG